MASVDMVRAGRQDGRMALFAPPFTDERDGLLTVLDQQRAALRASVLGLSDDQARATPAASSLSLGGLIKHASRPERPVRWVLLHLIKETARHAGHADLIREALDGRHAGELDQAYEAGLAAPA